MECSRGSAFAAAAKRSNKSPMSKDKPYVEQGTFGLLPISRMTFLADSCDMNEMSSSDGDPSTLTIVYN